MILHSLEVARVGLALAHKVLDQLSGVMEATELGVPLLLRGIKNHPRLPFDLQRIVHLEIGIGASSICVVMSTCLLCQAVVQNEMIP